MTAAALATIIEGIQLGIVAANAAAPVVKAGKDFISSLFSATVITADQQNAAHAHIEAIETATISGQEPPSWVVAPDPV